MKKLVLVSLLAMVGCAATPPAGPAPSGPPPDVELEPHAIGQLLVDLADRPPPPADAEWKLAALHAARLGLTEVLDDGKQIAAVRALGDEREWRPDPALALALPYLTFRQRDRDRRTSAPTVAAFDRVCGTPGDASAIEALRQAPLAAQSLAMAALALAPRAIGQAKYADCAERWLDGRFAPRFLDHHYQFHEGDVAATPTARASGWALLGVLGVLASLPEGHAERAPTARLFAEVSARLRGKQRPDGTWARVIDGDRSTSDPVGSALVTHALAAGVNRGLLDRVTYEPAVRRAWLALARGPRPVEAEGLAAWLLAGSELFRLTLLERSRAVIVVASNPLAQPRFAETVEIPWAGLAQRLSAVPGDPVVAVDARTGRFLPAQLLDENGDALAEKLLVSASLLGNEARGIVVRKLARPFRQPLPPARAHGRYVPRPHEDFAWENDRVAFRFFSAGIDVWAKRVREPVIDRWYGRTDLHRDSGEGLDFYQVGPTLGCGGLGLWDGNELHQSRNFRSWRLIAGGPVRVAFELGYEAWGPADARVTETKRVSLDLGHNLSRIESRFAVSGKPRQLPVAVGVLRRGEGTLAHDEPTTWLSYVEPPQGQSGQIGCGVLGLETVSFVERGKHYLLVRDHDSAKPFVYYAGAYWSKAPDFRGPDEWSVYLAAFSRRATAPIDVSISPP